jgi:hypothetical protein
MELSRRLLLCPLVTVWVLAAAAAAAATADVPVSLRPGCARNARCGDINVPYPFVIDEQCEIRPGFYLNCTAEGGTTTLFRAYPNFEVTKISVQDNKVWFKTYISRQCYNESTKGMTYNDAMLNITNLPYVLSADDNKIIVIGCNSLAYMLSNTVSNPYWRVFEHKSLLECSIWRINLF